MDLKNFNNKKNAFVFESFNSNADRALGILDFTPFEIRDNYQEFTGATDFGELKVTESALLSFYTREVSYEGDIKSQTFYDALQFSYLHTVLDTDGVLLDAKLFIEYLRFFLNDSLAVLTNVKDFFLYTCMLTAIHRMPDHLSPAGRMFRQWPSVKLLLSKDDVFVTTHRKGPRYETAAVMRHVIHYTSKLAENEASLHIQRTSFDKHMHCCVYLAGDLSHKRGSIEKWSPMDFELIKEVLKRRDVVQGVFPNLVVTIDTKGARIPKFYAYQEGTDVDTRVDITQNFIKSFFEAEDPQGRSYITDFEEIKAVDPIVDPLLLIDSTVKNNLFSIAFELPLKEDKYHVDKAVAECRSLITHEQLSKWVERGNKRLPRQFKLFIDESDHAQVIQTLLYLEQLSARDILTEKNTIILCLTGHGGGIDAVFLQVLRFQSLPCHILVHCEMLTSASIYYSVFPCNFDYVDPHPPVLHYEKTGAILWKNFCSMYKLIMRLFRGSPKALMIAKMYAIMFHEYGVKDPKDIHTDTFCIIKNSEL